MTKKLYSCVIGVCMLMPVAICHAQKPNATLFIEPFLTLHYDSNQIEYVPKAPSHTTYNESSGYQFHPLGDFSTSILIDATPSFRMPSQTELNKAQDLAIEQCKSLKNDTLEIYREPQKISYRGFMGFGMITHAPKDDIYTLTFLCSRYFDGGNCSILFTSNSKQKIKNYVDHYKLLTTIIDGIQLHSEPDLDRDEADILANIKISHEPRKPAPDLHEKEMAGMYYARMTIKGIDESLIKELVIPYRDTFMNFHPEAGGVFRFFVYTTAVGTITKEADIIVETRLGKKVHIPYKFSYQSKG